MRRWVVVSLVFHAVLAALLVGLSRMSPDLPVPEQPISVEIVADTATPAPSPLPPRQAPAEAAPVPQRQAAAPPPPPPAPKSEPTPPKPTPPAPPPKQVEAKPPPPPPPEVKKPEPSPEPRPEPKQAEVPKPPEPKQAEAPKPQPKKTEPPPEPPKAAEAPKSPLAPAKPKPPEPRTETAKAEPKREKPPAPPAEKAEASDFDALLRSVEAQSKRVQAPEKRAGKGVAAEAGGTGQPGEAKVAQVNPSALVASISRQITPCWNIPVAAQGIGGLRAELQIALGPDGSVQTVAPTDVARMQADPVFRAFAESAVRAVRQCSPLKLPPESYQVWRNVIFNFDPSMMAG